MLVTWNTCAVINAVATTIRQKQEPVSKEAFRGAVLRGVVMGPVFTGGLLLSMGGFFHRKS